MFFWKAHGTGNDFILVDDRSCTFPIDDPLLIERLCDRHRGIGADGLILLQNSSLADFKYRIFNSDGYEASMCGNGLRCLVLFLEDIGCNQDSFLIETNKGIRKVGREGENISVSLGEAMFIQRNVFLLAGIESIGEVWDTGVPHAVFWVDSLDTLDVGGVGKSIRFNPLLGPAGANVNFATLDGNIARIRTYERGVEKETLSCGTGAVAVAACYFAQNHNKVQSLQVLTASGAFLEVRKVGTELFLIGPAELSFKGEIDLSVLKRLLFPILTWKQSSNSNDKP